MDAKTHPVTDTEPNGWRCLCPSTCDHARTWDRARRQLRAVARKAPGRVAAPAVSSRSFEGKTKSRAAPVGRASPIRSPARSRPRPTAVGAWCVLKVHAPVAPRISATSSLTACCSTGLARDCINGVAMNFMLWCSLPLSQAWPLQLLALTRESCRSPAGRGVAWIVCSLPFETRRCRGAL